MVYTIRFWVDLIRFPKDFSVCRTKQPPGDMFTRHRLSMAVYFMADNSVKRNRLIQFLYCIYSCKTDTFSKGFLPRIGRYPRQNTLLERNKRKVLCQVPFLVRMKTNFMVEKSWFSSKKFQNLEEFILGT